jgi:hypothetical protein
MLGAISCKLYAAKAINPDLIRSPKEAHIGSLFVAGSQIERADGPAINRPAIGLGLKRERPPNEAALNAK